MTVYAILPKQVKNELNNKFCKYYGTLSIQINVALIAIVAKSTSTSTNGLRPHSSILSTIEYTVCEHFNILGSILQYFTMYLLLPRSRPEGIFGKTQQTYKMQHIKMQDNTYLPSSTVLNVSDILQSLSSWLNSGQGIGILLSIVSLYSLPSSDISYVSGCI